MTLGPRGGRLRSILISRTTRSSVALHHVPADVRDELSRHASRLGALGRRVHWLDTATSTNDIAARFADAGAEEGTTVVAES